MRVLIVSHNCISSTTNMGKTLLSYFREFPPEDLAQLYVHCEEPTDGSLCRNYFRFTDLDALLSRVCPGDRGRIFGPDHDYAARTYPRTDRGLLRCAYRYGEQRRAVGYALREQLWKGSRWHTGKLERWLEEFQPDAVFFASGDYGFSYEIARTVAQSRKIPLAVCCVDEYYLHNRNEASFLGRWVHRRFLNQVEKTMAYASVIFTICEPLKDLYGPMFCKPCTVLHTAAQTAEPEETGQGRGVVYLGKLELGREAQLLAIGRALRKLNLPGGPDHLDVYSWDRGEAITERMPEESGIVYHGGVSGEKAGEILRNSLAVIHTESFAPEMQAITRYSVSAKIPDCLMAGPCLIAYGPEGIASVDYLKTHRAAYIISREELLEAGLGEILTDGALRAEIGEMGRKLARENHCGAAVSAGLRGKLEEICEKQTASDKKNMG